MMVAMARRSNGSEAISLGKLSSATMLSRRYLEQVVRGLKEESLLRAVSGRSGGYMLARPADEITVGQIVEAAIGPISLVDCVAQPELCLEADHCECRWFYQQLNDGLRSVLDTLTLEDLAQRGRIREGTCDFPLATQGCPTSDAGRPSP
jgi:Rrf2 family protein